MSVTLTPSSDHTLLAVPAPRTTKPDCWPDCEPPTFARSMTIEGVCSIITHGSREVGIASSTSRVNVLVEPVLVVSTTGASLETVMVSSTVETASATFTCAVKPLAMRMFSAARC